MSRYIHGIQMLPLSPALLLSRTTEFCTQDMREVAAPDAFCCRACPGSIAELKAYTEFQGLHAMFDFGTAKML